ncbi:MAG: recombinase family protein [Lachnospiraceae bacterium]|nr:recombinase family protein [Lachnospiraceae bacterium]
MARISKRTHMLTSQQDSPMKQFYRAGIYARLSSDQDKKKNESIDIQVDISKKFVEDWNQNHSDKIEVIDCFIDLGKTGTNFNRDAFKRLMQEVRLGEINCIIVKDLSRFGRNYLEAGNYIEKIFPFLGVRFIAVTDGYDTGADGNGTKQMASEIKNLVNDMYAKDFSKKAKTSLKQRREDSSYVGGPPPYGYTAIWENRIRKLVPDENTAVVVRYIYHQFVKTENYQAVADALNQCRFNPPAVYKKNGEVYCPKETPYKGWDKSSVERILKSKTYIGNLVQGKTTITARNEHNRIKKPSEEWIITRQAHEGIIEKELFDQVSDICNNIRQNSLQKNFPSKEHPIGESPFDNILYCGMCGRKMTRHSQIRHHADNHVIQTDGYYCLNAGATWTDKCHDSNHITRKVLSNLLFVLLEKEFTIGPGRQKNYVDKGREYINQAKLSLDQKFESTERAITALQTEESRKYLEYRKGIILQKDYIEYKMQKTEKVQELEILKQELSRQQKALAKDSEIYLKAVRSLIRWDKEKELTRDLLETLVEKIYVYPGKRVEVIFRYTDALLTEVNRK